MVALSFVSFLFLFVLIGIISGLKSKKTSEDYLLASRLEKPWMIALCAVATNNSGYMFIGIIGYTYLNGLAVIWIFLPLIIGDYCASLFAYKNIRVASAKIKAISFPETLSRWSGKEFKIVRYLSSFILVIFLAVYAGAQLRAGGKAMHVLFNWSYDIGAIIGAVIVLIYCFAGGIRASIWTNTAQSFVMIFSMAMLFFVALNYHGGFENFSNSLQKIEGDYLSLFPKNAIENPFLGIGLFVFGWFFGGFGIIGQPHIMTSFMAMSQPDDIKKIRLYYYSWYIIFIILTILTGLISRILIPNFAGYDPELSLPILSQMVLPKFLIGFILAGIFSATMSTADSQILCCSATITNDLIKNRKKSYLIAKTSTIFITFITLIIALIDNQSVFSLVMYGWLALACSFTPIILIYSLEKNPTENLIIGSMLTGFISMMIWRISGLGDLVYEAGIGIPCAMFYYFIWRIFYKKSLNKSL
jgi:sodium/proline symporter